MKFTGGPKMTDLLTIRLPNNEKEALDFASHLSGMPVSKVILPYISEGTKVSLGALLLFRIDTIVYKKDRLLSFTELIMGPTKKGSPLFSAIGPEEYQSTVPKIIWDFFDLLAETRAISRINVAFEDVQVEIGTDFINPEFLKTLCYTIGDTYLSMGGSLESMNYQLANEIFFQKMAYFFYYANAKGTAKSLTTQWYTHGEVISKILGEMNDRYVERSGSRVMEAIVVSGQKRSRGRPRKKKKKALPPAGPQVVAKEI
jgi:hypothetical protein